MEHPTRAHELVVARADDLLRSATDEDRYGDGASLILAPAQHASEALNPLSLRAAASGDDGDLGVGHVQALVE
jgi:hypothetical protein